MLLARRCLTRLGAKCTFYRISSGARRPHGQWLVTPTTLEGFMCRAQVTRSVTSALTLRSRMCIITHVATGFSPDGSFWRHFLVGL